MSNDTNGTGEQTLYAQIVASFYDDAAESELQLARLTKEAMDTMSDEEWDALCAELMGGKSHAE